MDFTAMKRRDLQALCKRHGLNAGGSNADLAARLAATLSGSGAAEEDALGVVVGKGCLKRSAAGASGGDSDAAKKVTFVLEEDEEEEPEVGGRRLRSQVSLSQVVANTRGRLRAAQGSQVGGDSADQSDAGEAGADAVTRRSRRNAANFGAGDVVERVAGTVGRKTSAKAEQQEVGVGEAVGRKHQLKRKSRENDADYVDVSVQVGVSRRSTRLSALQSEPAAALSPVVDNKRARKKAGDLKEQNRVKEQPTEIQLVGRTLRSGLVVATPPLSTVSENKRSRSKVPEGETALEKVAELEISGRTTRSSSVAAAATSPIVVAKKRRKMENVHSDEGPHMLPNETNDAPVTRVLRNRAIQAIGSTVEETQFGKKMEDKRQPSRTSARSRIRHLASSVEEVSIEQVAAPCKGLPQRRSRRSPYEADVLLNNNTTSQSCNDLKVAHLTMLNAAKDGVEDGVAKRDGHVGLKKSKMSKGRATVATNGGEIPLSDSSDKASAMDMQVEVPGPVRRSMRKSVVPSYLEHETKGMHGDAEMKETVTKPVGRSTRRSVALVILEKDCKGFSKEMVPEAHVKRPIQKSYVPTTIEKGRKIIIRDMIPEARAGRSTRKPPLAIVNSKSSPHCKAASSEFSSAKSEELLKQQTVKQPIKRTTRKSFIPAVLPKDRKVEPEEMIPDAHVNNENGDHTKMISAKGGQVEKQLVVKEPSRRSTRKSVAPHVIEKEIKGFQEESKSEAPVRTSVRKLSGPDAVDRDSKYYREIVPHVIEKEIKGLQEESKSDVPVRTSVRSPAGPIAVDKESKDHTEIVTREESSVRTRSAQTRVQYPVQNDVSLRQTRHRSSKLVISPVQSKPTASKGRPAKRSRITSLEEVMPAEEHKEDQIAYGGHTSDMIDVATANGLESGVLPFPAEKSDLRGSQPNYQLEGTVVESSISHGKDVSNILEFELESTVVGTTEKPPSDLAFLDCKHAGALSEDALDSTENDAGRCSRDLEQSPTGLQFLFSQGDIEGSDTDHTSPSFKNGIEESVVHKVECQVETVFSLKPDSYEGSNDYSIRVKETGGLMFTSPQNNEQEGFPVSTITKDWVASVQLDSSEVVHHTVRDVSRKDMICNEEEKTDFIPSDISAPHKNSHAKESAEHVSGVSGALFCISQSTAIIDEVNLYSSQLSVGALDNHIASSNTEGLQHDNIEECNVHNERVTEGMHAGVMSEAAQIAVPESGKMLQPDVETLALPDEQLKRKPEGNEFKGQSFSRSEDESPKESTSCEDQIVLGPGICQTVARRYTYVVSVTDHNDECNQHSEDQLTSGILTSDMSEPALVEGSESGMALLPAEETTPLDEQLTTKLVGNTEQSLILDKDSGNVSVTEFLGNNYLSSLKDPTMDPCHDQELPNDMPAPKSPGESAVFLDDKVLALVQSLTCDKDGSNVSDTGSFGNKNLSSLKDPSLDPCHDQEHPSDMATPKSPEESAVCMDNRVSGSAGICQTSGSIVKGNYIAMHPLRTVKQVDNLSQSAAALLRNRENTPCKPDTLGPSCDHLFVIDSSAPMEPLLTEAGLAVGSPDEKLPMEQVQQDDLQVQEGTVEKTALGSDVPECKHECGLPAEAEPHSLMNQRSLSSIEQSAFSLQPLFSEDDQVEGTVEKTALGSATPECKHECVSPDKAGPHSLKNERCPSSIEQSLFGLQSLSSQDDVQVQEGTVEKTALGSATPECKDGYGFPDEADPHSLKNERGSSVEQSPFSVPTLFSQESIEEPSEEVAHSSARVLAENRVCESKIVSDISVDFSAASKSKDCLDASQQDNENEGLTEASHQQEQVAANCIEDADSEEVAYDEENKKPVHPTYIYSSCDKINVSRPVEHASGLRDALLSSSLVASTNDNDVHLSSNSYLFESTDFPDEIDWSNTAALHQGLKKQQSDEQKEYQVTYGAGTSDLIEVGTAKDIESGVAPLPAEETSNMRDDQLNTKLPDTEVAESGLGCDKGGINYLETESVMNSVQRNILSTSSLPKDCSTDDYQQMELFEGFSEQKSPEEPSMCWEASDPRAVSATIEKHSLDLAIRDFKHEGALSEDAVYSMKNTESCSQDHRQSSIGLHHLFSQESLKGSDVYDDIVLASTENEDYSNTPHVEKMASSEPDSHQCSLEDLSIVEEIRGLFSSQLDNEHKGFLSSSQKTECVASAQLHSSEDRNLMERDIITEVICKEEDKQGLVPSRDTDTPHETSHTDEPDEQRIILLQAAETSASPDKQLSSELEEGEFEEHNFCSEEMSGILGVGSVNSNVFHLHEDSHSDPIQGKELPNDLSAPKSPEQSAIGQDESVLGSGISQTVVQKRTEEINTKLQHERKEECSKYIDDQATLLSERALFGGSVSSGSVKNNLPHLGHNEEYYEHIDDPAILSSGMRKPSLIRGSESGIALQSAEKTSALTNEHLNFKMDEQGLYFDIDISDMSDTGLMENNNLSSLPKDNTYMETWNENEVSVGTPAAKSPGESAVCPDERVPGSVGICQTSGRRCIDEISTKLLSFKISSAVKGSYIAMDSADPKQGNNLSPVALLGNSENVPATKTNHPAK